MEFIITEFQMQTKHHEPDLNKWPNWPSGAWSVYYAVKYEKQIDFDDDEIEQGSFTIEGNHENLDCAMVAAATLLVQTLYLHQK